MRENNRLFDHLRSEYPDGLSKEQFYKIAHISKARPNKYLANDGWYSASSKDEKDFTSRESGSLIF